MAFLIKHEINNIVFMCYCYKVQLIEWITKGVQESIINREWYF